MQTIINAFTNSISLIILTDAILKLTLVLDFFQYWDTDTNISINTRLFTHIPIAHKYICNTVLLRD